MAVQLMSLFAFGLVITGIVFLGILQAREFHRRESRAQLEKRRHEDPRVDPLRAS